VIAAAASAIVAVPATAAEGSVIEVGHHPSTTVQVVIALAIAALAAARDAEASEEVPEVSAVRVLVRAAAADLRAWEVLVAVVVVAEASVVAEAVAVVAAASVAAEAVAVAAAEVVAVVVVEGGK
jgi:hypothetical protein